MKITEQPMIMNEMMKLILEHTTDGIFAIAYNGAIIDANTALLNMLGWELHELKGNMPVFIENMTKAEHSQLLDGLKNGKRYPYEIVKRRHKDGSLLDILASYWPINKGEILAIGMYKDFTQQMEIHRMLKKNERIYRTLVEHLPEAIIIQKNDKIEFINTATLNFLGAETAEQVIGRSFWDFISSENEQHIRTVIVSTYDQSDTGQSSLIVDKLHRPDGQDIYAEINIIPIGHKEEPNIQVVFRDITIKKNYESKLEHLAFHDPLTGLKNRRIFKDIVTETIETADDLHCNALLYIDLDKFKHVNDTYGHHVGDQMLKQFAKRLVSCVRQNDVVCRVGGDEFLILLKDIHDKQTIVDIVERILQASQKSYEIGQYALQVTASVGISEFTNDSNDFRSLLQRADQALYKAKEHRNHYMFYSSLRD